MAEQASGAATVSNNLPRQLTSFVGRERELAEVNRLLETAPLLTLTGAGGCGKTRLALQVAAEILDACPDGVWLVELAPLTDPALVPRAIASTFGVREAPGQTLTQTLADYLRARTLLLVLDNCEHLVAACAEVAEALLRACPALRVLTTSREALEIGGETTWRVPSLSVPSLQPLDPVDRLTQYEAMRLFIDRAAAALPAFRVTNQNAPTVAQVCHRLDGIPLAIELAAARVKVLPVEQILARLDDRFRLLTGGSRTALPRQQTLRAMVDWSYDLLRAPERLLLRRLSVFAGGWALKAAEAVCAGDGIAENEVLDLLAQLVDKSLVQAEAQGGQERYRLLETIRQYGREKLEETGEAERLRNRHFDFFLALAGEAEPRLRRREQLEWWDRLAADQDNLRAALEWSGLDASHAEAGLRLAGALGWFWLLRNPSEGRVWLESALAQADGLDPDSWAGPRAKAHVYCGKLASEVSDWPGMRTHMEKGAALCRAAGDKWHLAYALAELALGAAIQGDFAAGRSHVAESGALYRELGEPWGLGRLHSTIGFLAFFQRDLAEAAAAYEESLRFLRQIGERYALSNTLNGLADALELQGNLERAAALSAEALAPSREIENKLQLGRALARLGHVHLASGNYGRAVRYLLDALKGYQEIGQKLASATAILQLAAAAAGAGQSQRAARLFGAAEALYEALGVPLLPWDRTAQDRYVPMARAGLDAQAFAHARAEGQMLTIGQAIAEAERIIAIEPGGSSVPGAVDTSRWESSPVGLTEREAEVLRLVARGLTSAQVAAQLVISPVTVSTHLRNIYGKIGVNTRAGATKFAIENGLV
jgi:non-specific serine/threonine protein kinase